MYIAELRLSRADYVQIKQENNGIFDAYTVHKLVYDLFPKNDHEKRDFLYMETEHFNKNYEKQILIVCVEKPHEPAIGKLRCEEMPADFLDHEQYGFEVIANPVKRDSKSHKLVAIRSNNQAEQAVWFYAKAPECGFIVERGSLNIGHTSVVKFSKAGNQVTLARTQFLGRLKVTDRTIFKKTFCEGFGRGKAFGCGLLRIVPLQQASDDAQ